MINDITGDFSPYMAYFPSQKLPSSKKTKDWVKKVIKAVEGMVLQSEDIRESYYNKVTNYNLANDILDPRDIQNVFNPLGFESGKIPAAIQHYNISMAKINLLVGEEWKRKYDFRLVAANEDSHSEREKTAKELLIQIAMEELQNPNFSEEKAQQRIKELDKYMKYEYKDFRELVGTRILNHIKREQNLKFKINNGFMDALLVAEELYRTDIISGNVKVTKVDPKKLFTIRNSDSPYLEDAEIIAELEYKPIGHVIDEFHEHLTSEQISKIEKGNMSSTGYTGLVNVALSEARWRVPTSQYGELLDTDHSSKFIFGGYMNQYGEVRILRIRWKSLLKRYKKIYFNEFGEKQEDVVSEYYKLTPEEKMDGVELKEFWITEWWEAIQILDDIIVKYGPRPVQFRNMSNPSISSSGYVGTYYNINNNKAISLMDRMKPFQYLYNVGMRRLELAFAKWKTPVMQLNQTLKPDNWQTDKWLYYADVLGYLLVDPFNEGQEGAAKGVLSGSMNTFTNDFLNPQMGSFIQYHVQYVDYIESVLSKISGVTEQREGQISNRETVGGIERSVTQSNHITEYWFRTHEDTVRRLNETILETAKVAYRESKNKSIPYILDDVSVKFMEIDPDIFNESEYNLFMSDGEQDTMIFETIKGYIQPFLQNGGSLSQAAKMLRMDSITQIIKTLELDEDNKAQQAQQQQEAQIKAQQEAQQQAMQIEQSKLELDATLRREEMENQYNIAKLKADVDLRKLEIDSSEELPEDNNELDEFDKEIRRKEIALKESEQRLKESLGKEKLKEDKRKNRENESIKREQIRKAAANRAKSK